MIEDEATSSSCRGTGPEVKAFGMQPPACHLATEIKESFDSAVAKYKRRVSLWVREADLPSLLAGLCSPSAECGRARRSAPSLAA